MAEDRSLADEALAELWRNLVLAHRTLPLAFEAAGFRELPPALALEDLRALCVAAATIDAAEPLFASLVDESGAVPRATLLQGLRPRWRTSFRDWANAVLLAHAPSELAGALGVGDRRALLMRRSFSEALDLAEVHPEDGEAWFRALRVDGEPGALHVGTLVRRILMQPWLEGETSSLEDVGVRLIHTWGDLNSAFALRPQLERLAVQSRSPDFMRMRRSSSVDSISRKSVDSISRKSAVGPASPRTAKSCVRTTRASITEMTTADELWPGPVSTTCDSARVAVGAAPNKEQWTHALRGSARCRLMHEGQARKEAAALAQKQHSEACSSVAALFPNVRERLCVARTVQRKNELIVVRYSLTELGFYGTCVAPEPNSIRTDTTLDSLHSARMYWPSSWGSRPFIAAVPLGAQLPVGEEVGNLATRAPLDSKQPPHKGFGIVALRAPLDARSGGEADSWALQLFASDDGRHVLGPVGAPLPFSVIADLPSAPGQPRFVATETRKQSASLTVTWRAPEDDGGADVIAHELSVCKQGTEEEVLRQGPDVLPTYRLEGLEPSTFYILRVRCENEVGLSPWSQASVPLETAPPEPTMLGKPEVPNVLRTSATVRWPTSDVPITGYALFVQPHDGSDAWAVSVDPPPKRAGMGSSQTEATVDGLRANTVYTFSVRGVNETGLGPLSDFSDPVTTQPDVPGAPGTPDVVEAKQTSLTISWAPPSTDGGCPVVRYFVRGVAAGEDGTFERHTRDASTTLTVKGLMGNTRYVFWICALNSSGLSASSPPSSPLLTGPVAPGPPCSLALAEVADDTATLRWQPPADSGGTAITCYHVDVSCNSDSFAENTVEPSILLVGLRGNAKYSARVHALNDIGTSTAAAELSFCTGPVPAGPPGPPRALSEGSAYTATLEWSAPASDGGASVTAYVLQSRLVPREAEPLQEEFAYDVEPASLCATVEGLQPERSYRFRVRARTAAGEGALSDWSAPIRTGPAPPASPPPPTIVRATTQTFALEWPQAGTALEWEVMASCVEDLPAKNPCVRAHGPPAQLRGLAPRTAYVLHARVRGVGGWSEWSAASEPCATTDVWSTEEIVEALLSRFGSMGSAFHSFDRRCDGFLPLEDFVRGLDAAGLEELPQQQKLELFAEVDEVQRGCITLREFSKLLGKLSTPRRPLQKGDRPATPATMALARKMNPAGKAFKARAR